MTATTQTLAEFLLEQVAADEQRARMSYRVKSHDLTVRDMGDWIEVDGEGMRHAEYLERFCEPAPDKRVLAVCEAHRRIVELHQNWPVLVETQPTFEPIDSADPSSFAMRASQQIAWLTEQEYRVRFGTEPPAAPMLRALAAIYADRDGFREEWR